MDGKKVIIVGGVGIGTQLPLFRKSIEFEPIDIVDEANRTQQHLEFEIKKLTVEPVLFFNQKIRSKYKRNLKYR